MATTLIDAIDPSAADSSIALARQWTGPPLPDGHTHLSGMTMLRSLVSTTKIARSLARSVLLALRLTR